MGSDRYWQDAQDTSRMADDLWREAWSGPLGSYRGEKEILFDEFDHELWPITAMNRYLDKWRCLLDARYNDRYAAWERVVICANSNPQSWYPSAAPLLLDAFRRRIRGHCFYVDSQDPSLEALQQQEPTPL